MESALIMCCDTSLVQGWRGIVTGLSCNVLWHALFIVWYANHLSPTVNGHGGPADPVCVILH